MRVLLINAEDRLPSGMDTALVQDGWGVTTAADYKAGAVIAQEHDVAAVIAPQPSADNSDPAAESDYRGLLRALDARRIATILVSDDPQRSATSPESLVEIVHGNVTQDELRGRLATIRRYHALVRGMEQEVENLQRITKRINEHFNEVDQEMQLAGRLQRDFLPRKIGPVGPAHFATLFRPVTWVSGDIYDIFRIDEQHVGFYVADAVGHGMAASLLTMFIKNAFTAKEITPTGYRVLDPSETLTHLNEAILSQNLPHCQFVTACYCVLNTETLVLRFARGGHPYPLLASHDGTLTELKSQGGLMGLFREATFPTRTVQLQPGDKLILYTDGIEVSFAPREDEPHSWEHYRAVFDSLAHEPIDEIVRRLEAELNSETGSLNPKDDVTLVGMQLQS
jgi:phosphoserine phosphatase RsbU/P